MVDVRAQLKKSEANEFAEWRKHTVSIRRQMGLPVSAKPWTKHASGVPDSDRAVDVVDCGWWKLRKANPGPTVEELKVNSFCNLSQSNVRLASTRGHIGTLTPGSITYSYQYDCILSGTSHLMAIGWPSSMVPPQVVTDSQVRGLVGDSFSVPLSCVVQSACCFNPFPPWH